MNNLTIEIPQGFQATLEDNVVKITPTTKAKKPGPVTERIATVDDILEDNDLTRDEFEKKCEGLTQDEIAYRILKLLAKSLNEGWTPDWSDDQQYKYYPWFEMLGSSGFRFFGYGGWGSSSDVGSRLCFKSRELAEYAGRQFVGVYNDFMTIK